MRRSGFTLIEISAVLAIGATLTLSAAVCLRGPFQSARFESTVERVVALERQSRDHSRRLGRSVDLIVDVDTGLLTSADSQTNNVLQRLLVGRATIVECLVLGRTRTHTGATTISISERGRTTTYALHLRGPAAQSVWLVVAGITGQVVRMKEDDEVKTLLTLLESPGANAH